LCPAVQFHRRAGVNIDGQAPDADEIAQRVDTYCARTTKRSQGELQRLRERTAASSCGKGQHDPRSELPFLFEGRLPDLNLGTSNGASCSPALQAKLEGVLAAQSEFDWVANGRFKGGYITRHYAAPARHRRRATGNEPAPVHGRGVVRIRRGEAPRAQAVIRRLLEAAIG
jgi:N-formylglutamate deformylase